MDPCDIAKEKIHTHTHVAFTLCQKKVLWYLQVKRDAIEEIFSKAKL